MKQDFLLDMTEIYEFIGTLRHYFPTKSVHVTKMDAYVTRVSADVTRESTDVTRISADVTRISADAETSC